MRNRLIISLVVFIAFCSFSVSFFVSNIFAQESARIIIEKIEPHELDKLMKSKESRSLVVAMASWCGPCREELPVLIGLNNKYRDLGLKIVGISVDVDGPVAMQKIADKVKVNFPIYWTKVDMSEKYDIYAIPTIYLIKNGKIVEKLVGKQSEALLDNKIGGLLK
ncbi:MAG: TlpA family protein disulfide reductase [Proteobacteria bacterium]|nr:TlpA family protein disulfide reductase [Pseudomonadota bacterium]